MSLKLTFPAGPNTMVGLSKQPEGVDLNSAAVVSALVPAYTDLLEKLKALGVPEVQIHEPILTTHRADALKGNFESSFAELNKVGLPIDLVTYYDDVGAAFPWVITLPVQVPPPPCCTHSAIVIAQSSQCASTSD